VVPVQRGQSKTLLWADALGQESDLTDHPNCPKWAGFNCRAGAIYTRISPKRWNPWNRGRHPSLSFGPPLLRYCNSFWIPLIAGLRTGYRNTTRAFWRFKRLTKNLCCVSFCFLSVNFRPIFATRRKTPPDLALGITLLRAIVSLQAVQKRGANSAKSERQLLLCCNKSHTTIMRSALRCRNARWRHSFGTK